MARYFERAEAMLKPAPYPETPRRLDKFNALRRSAQASRVFFAPVPMLVNFAPLSGGVNHAGMRQNECVGCGDCITGCNYGAKNTVLMNYLPAARAHGAQIFTGTSATNLTQTAEGWRVSFMCANEARVVEARRVVLAAGSLGSTELLLRSRSQGLALSSVLGHRFSGNGDAVGLLYNADVPVNAIGFGEAHAGERAPVGTCSTGIVDYRAGRPLNQGMIMVDGAIPGAFAKWLPALLGALAAATGRDTDSGWVDRTQEKARELQSHLAGAYSGAVQRTQICLVVAHDDAGGTMSLEGDRLTIRWPGVGRQSSFEQADDAMRDAARALGATYIPNPIWHEWLGRKAITGHPLGGCPMADDARDGVVNHRGEVFSGESGTAVHPGLYVMDGAVVPRSLGVNPLLTITALAERACEHLVASERV